MALFTGHTITPDSALGGIQIDRSLRFDSSAQASCGTYFNSASNRRTMTFSAWLKRGIFATHAILDAFIGDSNRTRIFFNSEDKIQFFSRRNDSDNSVITTGQFRDPTTWYHLVVAIDTTQSTASNRVKIYINGEQLETNSDYPPQNADLTLGNQATVRLGLAGDDQGDEDPYDGYMAEVNYIDGQSYDPTYFGFADGQTGIWMPKKYGGAYGSKGFHIEFKDNSAVSDTTLGKDTSGNNLNFNVYNFSVSAGSDNDSMIDTPTNNFPTLAGDIDDSGNGPTDGNLKGGTAGTSGWRHTRSTVPLPSSGKWYWEYKVPDASADGSNGWMTGIAYSNLGFTQDINSDSTGLYGRQTDSKYNNSSGSPVTNSHFTSPSNNDILQFAYDADSQTLFTGRNNTWELSANPSTGANPNWTGVASGGFPMVGSYGSSRYVIINFGQQGFSYTPPTGYRSLSSKNRATPVTAEMTRPQRHFDTLLYTGNNNTSQNITGLEFQPDLVWVKNRDNVERNHLVDSVRGNNLVLNSEHSDGERTGSHGSGHTQLNLAPNGFNLVSNGSNDELNFGTRTYVAWCWKAGGAAVSNTDGDITSSVSVNEEAGFSIATYTGSTASGTLTVGHGLGKKPAWVMIKRRDSSGEWIIGHQGLTTNAFQNNKFLKFSSSGTFTNSLVFGAEPTTTVTQIVTDGNAGAANLTSSGTYVMYSWAEIPGYSKFGSYTGNGSTDGTYVHLGFKPAYLMIKNQNNGFNWVIQDYKRSPTNLCDNKLNPDSTAVEQTDYDKLDMLSNGFKPRVSDAGINASSSSYVYMAFAEQPTGTFFGLDANAR